MSGDNGTPKRLVVLVEPIVDANAIERIRYAVQFWKERKFSAAPIDIPDLESVLIAFPRGTT